jgi:HlyD family secretion protein
LTWKRISIGVALLVAIALALGFFWPFGRRSAVLDLPGVVEIQEVRLGSKIGGRVESVNIMEGQIAQPDQILVTFAVPELKAQREQQQAKLDQASADLEKARNGPRPQEKDAALQALESAKAKWELLKAGFRKEERSQAKSQYESAQSELRLAQQDYDRASRLYQDNSLGRADYDAARSRRDVAFRQAAKAKAQYEMMEAGSRPEEIQQAYTDMKRLQAFYDLLLAGTREEDIKVAEGHVAEARGKLQEIDANLAEAVVRAPERVVVDVLAVRKGDLVSPNQPILRVLRASDMWVKAYVPETQLGQVRLNQAADVTIDSYPGRVFNGTVIFVASESEFTPRNVQSADERAHQVFGIKIRVEDPEGIFKSGMAARAIIPLQ